MIPDKVYDHLDKMAHLLGDHGDIEGILTTALSLELERDIYIWVRRPGEVAGPIRQRSIPDDTPPTLVIHNMQIPVMGFRDSYWKSTYEAEGFIVDSIEEAPPCQKIISLAKFSRSSLGC